MEIIIPSLNTKKANVLALFCLLLFLGNCAPKSHLSSTAFKYHINGRIEGSQDGDTLLLGIVGSSKRINTAIIKNSKFKFTGIVPELSMGVIQYKHSFNITNEAAFVIEKAPIVIQAHVKPDDEDYADGKIIKAGKQNGYLKELKALQQPSFIKMNEAGEKLQQAQAVNNLEEVNFYGKKNVEPWQEAMQILEKYIEDHPNAIGALYNYYDSITLNKRTLETTLSTLNLFDDQIKKTNLWQKARKLEEVEAKN